MYHDVTMMIGIFGPTSKRDANENQYYGTGRHFTVHIQHYWESSLSGGPVVHVLLL